MATRGLVQGDNVPKEYEELVAPHVESMNFFLAEGMSLVVQHLEPLEIRNPATGTTHIFHFEDPRVHMPYNEETKMPMLPAECREAGTTYKGQFDIRFCWTTSSGQVQYMDKRMGYMPIMARTKACHLHGKNRDQLVRMREEANEMGGFFVCNGIERMIRCLIAQRRHYIMALRRGAYHKRGANYTECATLIRCVRPDLSSATVRCHYLTDGTVNFAFTMRRAEYFIPAGLLLKCFMEVSDRELYDKIMAGAAPGSGHAAFVAERAELLLQVPARQGLRTRAQCLAHLGSHFRVALGLPEHKTDMEVAHYLLREYVFIHLEQPADKLQLLLQMLHKLYALVNSACGEDNPDALTHHELLLPGHLLCKFLKERLEDCMGMLKTTVEEDFAKKGAANVNLDDEAYIKRLTEKWPDIGRKFEYLLNTGNLISKSGLDLSQTTGFTVIAEKLNFFRYLSHFRSVHRGAYFAELRTTTVRKLLPESWGFFCPVHTPDGSPCGLLNHFTTACRSITHPPPGQEEGQGDMEIALMQILGQLGMQPVAPALVAPCPPKYLTIMIDGKVAGYVQATVADALVARLRTIKALKLALESPDYARQPGGGEVAVDVEELAAELDDNELQVPSHMEIVHIPFEQGGTYPGIFLFTQLARMVRPVRQTGSGMIELIGTLEQNNMNIKVPDGGFGGTPGLNFSHAELNAGAMLSLVASFTPYSDYNQSPRNMYQCQMGKQTMGTPVQAFTHRTDNKMYRLQNPQAPIARTAKYDKYHMDEFPNGTNAVVAVLAYTGFDMEDAMILNKSSMERGLAHANLYKTEMVDLRDERGARSVFAPEPHDSRTKGQPFERPVGAFGQRYPQNVPSSRNSEGVQTLGIDPAPEHKHFDHIGEDGLPYPGSIVWPKQPLYCTKDEVTGKYKAHLHKGEEVAYIDKVTLVGTKEKGNPRQRANIRMRINRNPMIGDKFASRAGQKGVLSILWPDVDMPYCASTGIRPDLIINPHAFPSRMTIGMLVESMGAKAGALRGEFVDATPFQKCDGKPGNPIDVFGRYLEAAGFARHGQEVMISGINGEEMPCHIFIGIVYYQRLRHMVSDKFQVRSTGPINNITKQPVKGRKLGGGIRLGEMERDSLLAHGAAYLLHDRLHSCSDYHVMDVCTKCGSLVAPHNVPHAASDAVMGGAMLMGGADVAHRGRVVCPSCNNSSKNVERVAMPYVFKYLATELAAMNIKVELDVK